MRRAALVGSLVLVAACSRWAGPPRFGSLRAEEREFEFAHNIELSQVTNGMKIALVRDRRTNLITVDVRYQVGAAEDPPGRAGLAHLVEHLMFVARAQRGGPTIGDELSELALHYNAWTSPDATHYTATAPAENLEALIALEARRMRVTCDQIDPATFARERDVVLSEEAERHHDSHALRGSIYRAVYGADHPYARDATSEVAQVTRAEVCAFIAAHYTPERAILVITGPIDPARTLAVIGPAFGPLSAGRAERTPLPAPTLSREQSEHTGPVDHPMVAVFFRLPRWGADGRTIADLLNARLASALDQADDREAWIRSTDVDVIGDPRQQLAMVMIEVDDASRLAAARDLVFAEAAKLATEAEPPRTLSTKRGRMQLDLVAGWDRILSRGSLVADYLQYTDHHWFMLKGLAELDKVAPRQVAAIAKMYDTAHVALIRPEGDKSKSTRFTMPSLASHQLQPWRTPVDPAEAQRPLTAKTSRLSAQAEHFILPNGLEVVLAPDLRSPIVDARLVFPVGSAHEPAGRPALAAAAAHLVDFDTEGRYQLADYVRIDWALRLGTQREVSVDETTTTFSVRGLRMYGDWHVWWLSFWLDKGRYDGKTLDRLREHVRAADDDDDKVDPHAVRFLEKLFGRGHPYARPPAARQALLALGKGDLQRWRRDRFRARGATLIISGAFMEKPMRELVTELFGPWDGDAPPPLPMVPRARPARGPTWLAVRDDDQAQTRVTIAFTSSSDPIRDQAARAVLATLIEDRVRAIREGMGASYGVAVDYNYGARGGALVVSGLVDGSRSGEVLATLLAEVDGVRAGGGSFDADFVRARRRVLARTMAHSGGASAVANLLESLAARGLDLDHGSLLAQQVATLTPAAVAEVARRDLDSHRMVVEVKGKAASVDAAFQAVSATPE